MAVSTLFPQDLSAYMKQECPTYLKSTGKSKALVATLSDAEDDEILNALLPLSILLRGLLKMWLKKRNWWSLSLRRWIIKMISIQPMRNYTSFLRNKRNFIG